jgi:hypothetical protein
MNNIVEQDHRFIKKRIAASLWFRSVNGALNTIAGYEAMHMIRKGQIRWLAKNDLLGQVTLFIPSLASPPNADLDTPLSFCPGFLICNGTNRTTLVVANAF